MPTLDRCFPWCGKSMNKFPDQTCPPCPARAQIKVGAIAMRGGDVLHSWSEKKLPVWHLWRDCRADYSHMQWPLPGRKLLPRRDDRASLVPARNIRR